MGQAHAKPVLKPCPMEVSQSTGPDPTVFRKHVEASSPPSASAPMQSNDTDQTFSRIDYTSGGSLPRVIPNAVAKSKVLVRKLSGKPKGIKEDGAMLQTQKPLKTLEEDLQTFQVMVQTAEAKAGTAGMTGARARLDPLHSSKTTKASSFAVHRAKQSISQAPPAMSEQPITSRAIPFPESSAIPPHMAHFSLQRCSSANSIRQADSLRSTRRAEREWRARVAAIAAKPSLVGNSQTPLRGPVPPKRTPAPLVLVPAQSEGSRSPPDIMLLTPPHLVHVNDKGTPAKSFTSNKSFETLGHYAHLSAHRPEARVPLNDESPCRDRRASVPQSVSSFYFDNASRVTTRPSSMAAPLALSTISSDTSLVTPTSTPKLSPDNWHKISLPPFDSFQHSPKSVGIPLSPIIPPSSFSANTSLGVPQTPCSPTTAFILSAPIDDIGWSQEGRGVFESPRSKYNGSNHPEHTLHRAGSINQSVRQEQNHPYATALFDSEHSNSASPPACDRYTNNTNANPEIHPQSRAVYSDDLHSIDPFGPTPLRLQKTNRSRPTLRIPFALQPSSARPGPGPPAQRVQPAPAKMQILGRKESYQPQAGNEWGDLTPGMETGNRPPKSGLPVSDLERWLKQTQISD